MNKILFILFRGMGLFGRYVRAHLLSIIALSALFIVLHTVFATGSGIIRFADSIARFDSIRVYPIKYTELLKENIASFDGVADLTVYSAKDSKSYLEENAPAVGGLATLPEDLFPVFIDVEPAEELQNINSLAALAATLSELEGVESVSYGGEWIERVANGENAVQSLLMLLAVLFSVAVAVVVYQIIHITLYSYSDEIRAYSIVGGTNIFIILPFVVMAACVGAICAILSYAGYLIVYFTLLSPLENFLQFKLSLDEIYYILFFIVAVSMAKISGFLSASIFLRKMKRGNDE